MDALASAAEAAKHVRKGPKGFETYVLSPRAEPKQTTDRGVKMMKYGKLGLSTGRLEAIESS